MFDLASAIGIGAVMAVVGALLPAAARQQGLGALGLALLAALPFAANLLSLLAGRIGPRTPAQLALLRMAGASALVLVALMPHPAVIALATFAFWASFVLGVPLQQRLWSGMYPASERGRLIGIVGTGRFTAATAALLIATLFAGGAHDGLILIAIAFVGAIAATATARLRPPDDEPIAPFSVAESLRSIGRHKVLQRLTLAQLFFGAGLVASPPLIAMVYVDRLALTLDEVALAGLVLFATRAVAVGPWGRLAVRVGGLRTAAIGSGFAVAGLLGFAAAGELSMVLLASAAIGAAGAAIEVAWPVVIAENAEPEAQAAAAAGLTAIMGARGLIVPFVMMAPIALGLISVTAGLVIAASVTLAGAVLYAWAADLLEAPRRAGLRARMLVVTAFGL